MATAARSRAGGTSSLSGAIRGQRQEVHRKWCERHPDRAAEERALRQARREAVRDFGHKVNGTVETHAKASRVRQGALARLYRTGAISIEQLGAALEIAVAHQRITGGVTMSSGWGMDRVDTSLNPEKGFYEALGAVRSELAYSRWRRQLPKPGPVLAMVADDIGVSGAARLYSMHVRRAKRLLIEALDLWARLRREACREVDDATLAAAHAGIL